MKKIILLGASGSIGTSTLEVLEAHPDSFKLVAASCHNDRKCLSKLQKKFKHIKCCLSGNPSADFDFSGRDGLFRMIEELDADLVVNAVSGSAGMELSWKSLLADKHIALANKESIVMAGSLLLSEAKKRNLMILPVDSEHSALFYLMKGDSPVSEIIITASGGPFFHWDKKDILGAKPKDALKHPTWDMGKKITIDSASMANKGLEVIEASYLFDLAPENIKVTVHRESLVHSFIRTKDNALLAHISLPDMKLPIQNALFYPQMEPVKSIYVEPWELNMSFSKPRNDIFPMLPLAYQAVSGGQDFCIVYNAANEMAVDLFLKEKIPFMAISEITAASLNLWQSVNIHSIDDVLACNEEANHLAKKQAQEYL